MMGRVSTQPESSERDGFIRSPSDFELWDLAWGQPEVDPTVLAHALDREAMRGDWDFRTRLLVRDTAKALRDYWGEDRWHAWVEADTARRCIEGTFSDDLGGPGFHLTKDKLVPATRPESIKEFLRELGSQLTSPATIEIGGAISLILSGHLSRATADIDVVDEVPSEIRSQQALLAQLEQRHGLALTHFQSHYLPEGWRQRLHSLGTFGRLHVARVDAYDIFLCKLFSNRTKDLDDLRALKPNLDQIVVAERLSTTTGASLRDASLRASAERNWYILYGESLPVSASESGNP